MNRDEIDELRKNDPLLKLMEKENYEGCIIFVFEKGGDGPEGIIAHTFTETGVKRIPQKLRIAADKWEEEYGKEE